MRSTLKAQELSAILSGKMLDGGEELKSEARLRKKDFFSVVVPKNEEPPYLQQGYKIKRILRNTVSLTKKKDSGQKFEDEIWTTFYNMGFDEINQGNLIIGLGGSYAGRKKQIDVLIRHGADIFVIECKARSRLGKRSLRKDILETVQLKPAIEDALKTSFGAHTNITFLFVTENVAWSRADRSLARLDGIIGWHEPEISYFSGLTKILGKSTKYQFFAYLFPNRRFSEKATTVPAIRGRMGEMIVYSFLIQPEKLLKIAYVHRRGRVGLAENAYQRMLKRSKLREIAEYINSGGFFANNIIVNFTHRPRFLGKGRGPSTSGRLRLPRTYASAWIIDGQHRLYGYANCAKASSSLLPVIAFHGISNSEQGKLFIDINKRQTPVENNLLWDLAGDIYENSEDPEEREQWATSTIVKLLNSTKGSPFLGHIFIPSVNTKGGEINLTITTLCTTIQKTGLLKPRWLYQNDYPTTTSFAAQRIGAFFKVVRSLNAADWDSGEKGLLRSNNGVSIFFYIFKEVIRYLLFADREPGIVTRENLEEFTRRCQELLDPIKAYLERIGPEAMRKMRSQSSVGQQRGNSHVLMLEIRNRYQNFAPSVQLEVEETEAFPLERDSTTIDNVERGLRDLVVEVLRREYGDKWWKQGIPGPTKADIEKRVEQYIKRVPYDAQSLRADPARKIEFSMLDELESIILNKPNWPYFSPVFEGEEELRNQFESLIAHRNQVKHAREINDHLRRKGITALLWFEKCRRYAREVVLGEKA